jgi:hypothetical protein
MHGVMTGKPGAGGRGVPIADATGEEGKHDSRPARPQDALLSAMDLGLRRTFYPLGFAVEFVTNRQEVLFAAEASFGHRESEHGSADLAIRIGVSNSGSGGCPPPPLRRQYGHLYSMVADPENQALLDLRTGANFVWLNEAGVRDALYLRRNFLEKAVYLLLGASVVTDIHAGSVSKHGKGILLCGDSGAGKSTLAYACARAGWTYTSDDTCYLINSIENPRVVGHSHRVRFRPAARALFPELSEHRIVETLEGKPSIEVPAADLPIAETAHEVNVSAVVYLRRIPSAQSTLTQLPPGSATRRMSQELYSAGEIRANHEKILYKFAATPTFELQYEGLEEAIVQLDLLVDALQGPCRQHI